MIDASAVPDDEGTYTVLISDLESSTELWEVHEEAMAAAIPVHNELLVDAVHSHRGYVIKLRGDGILAAFPDAADGLHAALAMQRRLGALAFGDIGHLRIRVGVHTGTVALRGGEIYGRPVNLSARLEAAGHGGQILISDATARACEGGLDAGIELFELGPYQFRGFREPVTVHTVVAPDLPTQFPRPARPVAASTRCRCPTARWSAARSWRRSSTSACGPTGW